MKKIASLAFVLSMLGSAALAQQVTPPILANTTQTDVIQDVPRGQPSAQSQYVNIGSIGGVPAYVYNVPLTAFSLTFGNTQQNLNLNPAGTLATGTITTAVNPSDAQVECIFSTTAVTALTLTANTGQTITNGVTALVANTRYCYQYDTPLAAWERIQ